MALKRVKTFERTMADSGRLVCWATRLTRPSATRSATWAVVSPVGGVEKRTGELNGEASVRRRRYRMADGRTVRGCTISPRRTRIASWPLAREASSARPYPAGTSTSRS